MGEPLELELTAQEIADNLVQEYGDEALLQAALCAHKAMASGSVQSCFLWRDILNILDDTGNSFSA